MKRIISFLLGVCLVLGLFPVTVKADDVQTKYLKVSVNEELKTYECLWDNEEIYCSVENLAEMTNYNWFKMEDSLEYQFFREYDEPDNYAIELQTSVTVSVDEEKAEIEAMDESYTVNCYFLDNKLFLPLEKLLYLLHAEWVVDNDTVYVTPMPLTILDFLAIHQMDLVKIASQEDDVLINTGWLLSDTQIGQAVYSTIAEVFSDFDGKIFMLWWPGEGNVETAECYENAILQLAKEDKEFVGEEVQQDALAMSVNSLFYLNNNYLNKIQNIMELPENVDEIVKSVPDAIEILKSMGHDNKKLNTIAKKIDDIEEIDMGKLPIDIPDEIGDGLDLLQCVWNTYDTATRVKNWNDEYLAQIQVLGDYQEFGSINDTVTRYVRSSAQKLIDSYQNPTEAAANEAIQSTMGLLLSKTFDASPFGKAFSIMNAVGSCYGVFDMETADTYDMYAELRVVTFSVKIEQMVKYLLDYNNLLNTTDKLTDWEIEDYRNQLMLYLRLNLRNKAQLYNLNVKGNEDRNWGQSQEAKELHNEIVLVYTMLAELIETKDYDSFIILDNAWDVFNSEEENEKSITSEILQDENKEDLYLILSRYISDNILGNGLGNYCQENIDYSKLLWFAYYHMYGSQKIIYEEGYDTIIEVDVNNLIKQIFDISIPCQDFGEVLYKDNKFYYPVMDYGEIGMPIAIIKDIYLDENDRYNVSFYNVYVYPEDFESGVLNPIENWDVYYEYNIQDVSNDQFCEIDGEGVCILERKNNNFIILEYQESISDDKNTNTMEDVSDNNNLEVKISEEEALIIAREYWDIELGDIDEDTGFPLTVQHMNSEDNNEYIVALRWLVDNSHWSTIDMIYVNAINGECRSYYE